LTKRKKKKKKKRKKKKKKKKKRKGRVEAVTRRYYSRHGIHVHSIVRYLGCSRMDGLNIRGATCSAILKCECALFSHVHWLPPM
jgi:hypothetical protein